MAGGGKEMEKETCSACGAEGVGVVPFYKKEWRQTTAPQFCSSCRSRIIYIEEASGGYVTGPGFGEGLTHLHKGNDYKLIVPKGNKKVWYAGKRRAIPAGMSGVIIKTFLGDVCSHSSFVVVLDPTPGRTSEEVLQEYHRRMALAN